MDSIVCIEVAEAEFERFISAMDINAKPEDMDGEDKAEFGGHKLKIVDAITKGALVISDAGEPIYTPQRIKDAQPITFFEPTGASLMAMDRKKKTADIGKMFAAMGDITRTDAIIFSKMKMPDLKVCIAITSLFLA